MIASSRIADYAQRSSVEDSILNRVPQRSFGNTAWISIALKECAEHLAPAIRSGKSHRIANAVRAITHTPSAEQIDDVVSATCDVLLSEAYAQHDTRVESNVGNARRIIDTIIAESNARTQRAALTPGLVREAVDGFVRIVALLDRDLAQRLDSVGDLAVRIGSAMHLSQAELVDLEHAGRMHAIGSLAASGTTFLANSIECHPVITEAFLKSIPSLAHLAPAVRSQHERFDGRGYPDRLSGAEIPLAARIINVAATFVDLLTESKTHEASSANAACHELALRAGSEFDPDVVTAILHLLRYRQRTHRSA